MAHPCCTSVTLLSHTSLNLWPITAIRKPISAQTLLPGGAHSFRTRSHCPPRTGCSTPDLPPGRIGPTIHIPGARRATTCPSHRCQGGGRVSQSTSHKAHDAPSLVPLTLLHSGATPSCVFIPAFDVAPRQSEPCGSRHPPPFPSGLQQTFHPCQRSHRACRSEPDSPGILIAKPDENLCSGYQCAAQ